MEYQQDIGTPAQQDPVRAHREATRQEAEQLLEALSYTMGVLLLSFDLNGPRSQSHRT
jgi:hypothetical protein